MVPITVSVGQANELVAHLGRIAQALARLAGKADWQSFEIKERLGREAQMNDAISLLCCGMSNVTKAAQALAEVAEQRLSVAESEDEKYRRDMLALRMEREKADTFKSQAQAREAANRAEISRIEVARVRSGFKEAHPDVDGAASIAQADGGYKRVFTCNDCHAQVPKAFKSSKDGKIRCANCTARAGKEP